VKLIVDARTDRRQIGFLPRCFAMTLIRIGTARPCRFDRCRFSQPAVIGGPWSGSQTLIAQSAEGEAESLAI